MFRCDKCGQCCRNLHLSPIYDALHDGDGVCRYLRGNLCSIYETRPLVCRVDASYEAFFREQMTYEEYVQYNYKCCAILKKKMEE